MGSKVPTKRVPVSTKVATVTRTQFSRAQDSIISLQMENDRLRRRVKHLESQLEEMPQQISSDRIPRSSESEPISTITGGSVSSSSLQRRSDFSTAQSLSLQSTGAAQSAPVNPTVTSDFRSHYDSKPIQAESRLTDIIKRPTSGSPLYSSPPKPLESPGPGYSSAPRSSGRDQLSGTVQDPLYFYEAHQPYYEFTNFYESPFEAACVDSEVCQWRSVEMYFQASKFLDPSRRGYVRVGLRTAREAFDYSRKFDSEKRTDWEFIKENNMRIALEAKFTQNPRLGDLLLSTGDRYLVEASPVDGYWGYGSDKRGKNRLGVLLMELRDKLRRSSTLSAPRYSSYPSSTPTVRDQPQYSRSTGIPTTSAIYQRGPPYTGYTQTTPNSQTFTSQRPTTIGGSRDTSYATSYGAYGTGRR